MAVLTQNDWQPPIARDSSVMEPRNHLHPAHRSSPSSSSLPRQPSPDPSQHAHTHAHPRAHSPTAAQPAPYQQQQLQQQQPQPQPPPPQPYPTPQPPWQPSPQAPAFYPAYPAYFPQQAPLQHPHQPPAPYFDPNQHFAQWAYQQMMFNAQAQAQFHAQQQQQQQQQLSMLGQPLPDFVQHQRTRSNTPPAQQQQQATDYFQQPQRTATSTSSAADPQGFHPYGGAPRRTARQTSSASSSPSPSPGEVPQPPYARADAAGSSSSLNSGSSGRSRKGSNPTPATHAHRPSNPKLPPLVISQEARRPTKPSPLGLATFSTAAAAENQSRPGSSSASRPGSSGTIRPSTPPTPRQETVNAANVAPSRTSTSSKRLSISKDDSQLGDPVPVPSASMVRSGGLKGRLRRALAFNSSSSPEDAVDNDDSKHNSRRKALSNANKANVTATPDDASDPNSPTTPTGPSPSTASTATSAAAAPEASLKGKSRARRAASLFNTKFNASTDNISLSSTVSSASVMIRKLGSMGRLARKNSLMSITSLFKDKDKDKDNADGTTASKGKGKKGATAAASVTHATAEVDRLSGTESSEISGLSPAARLARQHTIRSEEAARQKAAEEARAREAAAAAAAAASASAAAAAATATITATTTAPAGGVGGAPVPVWERNTATRGARRGVLVEDEEDGSDEGSGSGSDDDGSGEGTYDAHHHHGWDDEDEEDVTIKVGSLLPQAPQLKDEDEPWAVGIRRSIERTRRPAKGILKNAGSYDQESILAQAPPSAPFTRLRSNSYNQSPHNHTEPGPLARIPSPDPDHIDGLYPHQHAKTMNGGGGGTGEFMHPPFVFEDAPLRSESPERESPSPPPPPPSSHTHSYPNPDKGFFNLANMNSSAPALSTLSKGHGTGASGLARGSTTPAKRLAFAANLSIYDTFSSHVYDRRSEPATCNRLTPALAQRIKEELNSYKMEEMEVHTASRAHTQFFV